MIDFVATFIVFFAVIDPIGIPLSAFQIAGGIVLFLFALTMIFGESKPVPVMGPARPDALTRGSTLAPSRFSVH